MNSNRFRNSTRANLSSIGSRRGVWIVLVLLLAVLMMVTTVLALDGPETVTNPDTEATFDSAEALRELRGILGVTANTIPSGDIITDQGCLKDVINKFGDSKVAAGCTAGDTTLELPGGILESPECTYVGEEITFTALVTVTSTSSDRYDVGIYFASDGDPNMDGARTGQCNIAALPNSPSPFQDNERPLGVDTNYFCVANAGDIPDPLVDIVPCGDGPGVTKGDLQCIAQTVQSGKDFCEESVVTHWCTTSADVLGFSDPSIDTVSCSDQDAAGDTECATQTTEPAKDYCRPASNTEDTCGDLSKGVGGNDPLPIELELTAICNDEDGNGKMDLPYCVTYDHQATSQCTSALGTSPGTTAKCRCNNTFDVPINVPPDFAIDKQGPATANPGDTFSYTIVYTNYAPGSDLTGIVITDQLHADLEFVSAVATDGTCSTSGGTGGFGVLVTCNLNDMLLGSPQTTQSESIDITVKVRDDAWQEQDIPNTACIDGNEIPLPPDDPLRCDTHDVTTPVTVSFFEASNSGDGTRFEWVTGSETGNAGFNIYVQTAEGWKKVNDSLILSSVVDSLDQQEYSFEAPGLQGESFYIEDVSIRGQTRRHGPFVANEAHGQRVEQEAIDWTAIQLENETLAAERAAVARAALTPVESAAQPANLVQQVVTWAGNLINIAIGRPVISAESIMAAYPAVDLRVKEDGIYRVTYEQLLADTGADLSGASASDLALSTADGNVPIYVAGGEIFGPGSYFEFYGQGLDTLYTDTNVYKLQVDAALARRVDVDMTLTKRKVKPASYYMETVAVEHNNKYGYLATNGDPWYDALMYTTAGLQFTRDDLVVDNFVDAAPSTLIAQMWGMTDLDNPIKHHVQLGFNGQPVADTYFVGQAVENVNEQVPAGSVQEGVNTVTFTVPNDQGGEYDIVALEMYGLTYPRAFVARNGQLDFSGAADAFRVTDLDSNEVVAYRVVGNRPTRLGRIKVGSSGGAYTATFAGSEGEASYYVSTEAALAVPEMALSREEVDITSGSADLLIIAHPNFIDGLGPLVAARQAQGYTVKVVNVEDVYAQHSGGVFDAQAIKDYIHYALNNMGVQYVILAGGDTKDPRDYSGLGSISFIPSLYAKTTEDIYFAPVDPLYTDLDGNNVPDAVIGRFPVRSVNQLKWMVDKTLLYDNRVERQTAAFAADVSYEDDSDSFVPAGWNVNKAYVGPDGLDTARKTLIDSMNNGPALTSFVGHSDTDVWTFDPLFSTWDAAALTNYDKPMVITQWGCFNTYYVGEAYVSLGDNFLLRPNIGAAAVTGATTITNANSERELGKLLMPKLVQSGMSIGQAMQEAKVELAANRHNRDMVDVLLGWTILGDPTLVVQP